MAKCGDTRCKLVRVQEDVKDVQREVEILNLVSDHPNVAELVNTFEDVHHVHLVSDIDHVFVVHENAICREE